MSKTDAYATKDMKGKIERSAPKKVDNGKKTTVRQELNIVFIVIGKRGCQCSFLTLILLLAEWFFDRMSKTDTYATNDMKGKIDRTVPKVDNGKKTTVRIRMFA